MLRSSIARQRSACPIARSLDLLGDRWTLLLIRDMLQGHSRFKEFLKSAQGIPTNILAERLERLVRAGLARRLPVEPGSKHLAYQLTGKGRALLPVLESLKKWGTSLKPTPRHNDRPPRAKSTRRRTRTPVTPSTTGLSSPSEPLASHLL